MLFTVVKCPLPPPIQSIRYVHVVRLLRTNAILRCVLFDVPHTLHRLPVFTSFNARVDVCVTSRRMFDRFLGYVECVPFTVIHVPSVSCQYFHIPTVHVPMWKECGPHWMLGICNCVQKRFSASPSVSTQWVHQKHFSGCLLAEIADLFILFGIVDIGKLNFRAVHSMVCLISKFTIKRT